MTRSAPHSLPGKQGHWSVYLVGALNKHAQGKVRKGVLQS